MITIQWLNTNKVRLIDQTRLPQEEVYLETGDYREVAAAIREMRIRGAPALGVAAAYGLALGALGIRARAKEAFLKELHPIKEALAATRPTARNLFWALERMERVAQAGKTPAQIQAALVAEAQRLAAEDIAANRALGRHGAELLEDGSTVLTHCNAGALATAGYGTALGVLRAAQEAGKRLKVLAAETRPLLQGARLTAWELLRDGFDVTLITDSMAGHFMRQRRIQAVLVGADRIAANGDTANKIGTYTHAVLAREHGLPFYVAAPTSTVDLSLAKGEAIPIEERRPEEVTHLAGVPIAPAGVKAANPAFDVTPHYYIDAIITEKGVVREPYEERLGKLCAP